MREFLIKHRISELVLFMTLAITGFWLWEFFESEGLIGRLIEYLSRLAEKNQTRAGLLFFSFSALSVLLGPFTSSPIVPVGVIIWGKSITFLLLISGWVSGSMLAYGIGKIFGYPLVSRILTKEKADEWRGFVSKRVTFLMAFLFRLGLPAETGYVFGLVGYSVWKYLLLTILVELPVALVIVFASGALIENDFIVFSGLLSGILGVFALAAYFLRKKSKQATSL